MATAGDLIDLIEDNLHRKGEGFRSEALLLLNMNQQELIKDVEPAFYQDTKSQTLDTKGTQRILLSEASNNRAVEDVRSVWIEPSDSSRTRYRLRRMTWDSIRSKFGEPGEDGEPVAYELLEPHQDQQIGSPSASQGVMTVKLYPQVSSSFADHEDDVEVHFTWYPVKGHAEYFDREQDSSYFSKEYPKLLLWAVIIDMAEQFRLQTSLRQRYQQNYERALQRAKRRELDRDIEEGATAIGTSPSWGHGTSRRDHIPDIELD